MRSPWSRLAIRCVAASVLVAGTAPAVALELADSDPFVAATPKAFGGPAWVHADALGNAAALHDGSASLEEFAYEPFGRAWDPVGGAWVTQSTYGHELLFQSSPHDLRHGLVRLGARDLDTRIGRFLSRDPLREAGGWNLYSYARANPLRWHDRSGLSPEQNQMPGGPLTGRSAQFTWITDLLDYLEQSVGQYEWRHGDVLEGKGFWDLSSGDKLAVLSLAEQRLVPEGWESREQLKGLRRTRDWLMQGRQAFEGIELAEQADWVLSFPERLTAEGLGGVGLDPLTARISSEIGWALYGALKKPAQEGLAGARKGVSEWIKRKILRKGQRLANEAAGAAGGVTRPTVANSKLKNLVDDLYKGADSKNLIGTGSTADAIRHELATGQAVGGRFHTQKGQEYARALEKWLSKNPGASASDRSAAQSILNDLRSALGGN